MAVSNSSPLKETWEPIPGYEGMYEASDRGRVRSLDRTVTRTDGRTRRLNGRLLKTCIDANTGYPKVTLYREATPTHRYVHALVAEAFLGPRPQGAEVAHRDGVKTNATLANLRYATSAENSADQLLHGTSNRGARNPGVVLNEESVLAIALGLRAGARQKDLAAQFGVSRTAVSAISTGRSWGYLTGRGNR
ncbi:MAG: hypothetical protein HOZ81_04995 [Streptomyces sp.]|nr:hypothetical protein [Streptomyces sp.]